MHVGIAIPQIVHRTSVDRAQLDTFLAGAERLGYDSAWVQDDILGGTGFLEPVALLSYAAGLTRRLRLGAAVVITTLRCPIQLAKSVATLDQLSGGRVVLGIGLGGNTRIYPAFGLAPEGRVRRFTEGLRLMKRLWSEEEVTLDGQFWKPHQAMLEPKPVQRPHPPVWIGARTLPALRRAVEVGDGWIGAGSASTTEFREQAAQVRRFLEAAGRDPSTFPVGKRVYLAVDEDRARALGRLREWFGMIYGNEALADRVALVGNAREVIEGLRAIRAAGAETLLLNPLFDEMEHLEVLARDVLPALRES